MPYQRSTEEHYAEKGKAFDDVTRGTELSWPGLRDSLTGTERKGSFQNPL